MGKRTVASVKTLRGEPPSSGDGSGYGYGYGSGSGYGCYGYGSGSGYGYGYGHGSGRYWEAILPALTEDWTPEQHARLEAVKSAARIAFWCSNAKGQPANSGRALSEAAAPGVVHRTKGPLTLCEPGTLHATLIPPKWQGERIWVVALHGEVVGDDEKLGCLEREILGECKLRSSGK